MSDDGVPQGIKRVPSVVEGKFGKVAPSNLANDLRELAAAVDAGKVVTLVAAYIKEDEFCFLFGASHTDTLVLSTLLQSRAIERMKQ